MQGAAKVGLFVIVFVGLLFGAYTILGRSVFAPKTARYYAEFTDAGGASEGARVLLAGVKVGQVADVSLVTSKLARLTLDLEEGVQLPEGTVVELPQGLLGFGDQPLLLIPPADASGATLKPGSVLKGSTVSPLQALLPESETTLKELNGTLAATRKLLSDQKLLADVQSLLATSDRTVAQFGALAQNASSIMADNRKTIAVAMKDAAQAINEVREGIRLATSLLGDPKLKDDAMAMLSSLKSTGEKADLLVQNLNELVTDPSLREPMSATMANVKTMSDSGTRIAASTEEIAKNGAVVSQKAIELADKANTIADEAHGALLKLQGFFERVPSTNVMKGLESQMDVVAELDPGRWRTDINFTLPVRDFKLHAGVFDAFETNKLNVQLGRPLPGGGGYRYGVYGGQPGFGVDLRIAPNLSLQSDLFGLNDSRLDIRARYDFGNDLVGWFGVNRVFDGNVPMVGIGLRR